MTAEMVSLYFKEVKRSALFISDEMTGDGIYHWVRFLDGRI